MDILHLCSARLLRPQRRKLHTKLAKSISNTWSRSAPEHQPIYERLKQARALERLQELLSPIRLPQPLLLKVSGCEGESNAWYEEGVVTVCYEYLHDILKAAPEQTMPSGITQEDGILGPVIDVFLHEAGHAVLIWIKFRCSGEKKMRPICFLPTSCCSLGKTTLIG